MLPNLDNSNGPSVQPFVLTEPANPFNAETVASEKTNLTLASAHPAGDSSSSSAAATAQVPSPSLAALETGLLAGGLPHSRMQQLQDLVQAFIGEIAAGGPDNENPGLGGAIAQLDARRDTERGRTGQAARPPPPAYELEDRNSTQDEVLVVKRSCTSFFLLRYYLADRQLTEPHFGINSCLFIAWKSAGAIIHVNSMRDGVDAWPSVRLAGPLSLSLELR